MNGTITEHVKKTLSKLPEVLFAYIHGSILSSDNPQDIDIAVFIDPEVYEKLISKGEVSIGFSIPVEMELERQLGKKVDFHVLNGAPLSFRYRVVTKGIVVLDNNSDARSDFEYLSRVQYFDFRPRRQEYLREVMS
jgi:predicted nucleotidyltransferase